MELEFRGFDPEEKKLYSPQELFNLPSFFWEDTSEGKLHGNLVVDSNGSRRRFVITQATGLADMAGIKIFEGDILNTKTNRFVVEYSNDRARFLARGLFYSKPTYDLNVVLQGLVIGNIFENPSLLESPFNYGTSNEPI